MFRFRRTDPHTLAGAYALNALGDADRARFERHLSGCPSCAQEARGLQEATSRLADTLAIQPPDVMRERVMAAVARTRQNPPVTEPAGAAWPARVGLPGQAAWRGRGARRGRRWGILIAGGTLAIALALGGLAFHTEQQLNQMRDRSRAIAAVLNEPDAAMMTVTAATQGSATIVMSHQARALVFTAARLPALPSSQRYELWLMGRDGPRAAGLLPQPRAGMTAPVIVSGLRPGDAFAVSAEPASGASRPTSPMILQVALSS